MRHGFIKVASGTPQIRIGDCVYNASRIQAMMERAAQEGARVLVLPELCVTGYTAGDLFMQDALLLNARAALAALIEKSRGMQMLAVVGLPLLWRGKLLNCAAALYDGALLGVVPRANALDYGEHYGLRQFARGDVPSGTISIGEYDAPCGTDLLFCCENIPDFILGIEIGGDLGAPMRFSALMSAGGATIIASACADYEMVDRAQYRRRMLKSDSSRLACAYVYANAGLGESTTDVVFSGHDIIVEYGALLIESEPFQEDEPLILSEIDVSRLAFERRRRDAFRAYEDHFMRVTFSLPLEETKLTRLVKVEPFMPQNEQDMQGILLMQAQALRKRLLHTHSKKAIIGVSGGLDSTLALLVAVRAMALLNRPASDVLAVTMPCFGTTVRTRTNAQKICEALGVPCRTVDITEAINRHFLDIGQDKEKHDAAFENAQARERTQVLMDIANMESGLVVGTGDLSELALGWATYNGDHMSMYSVNASIPKTLIRHIVRCAAQSAQNEQLCHVLLDILDTPVSPELLPAKDGEILQQTENIVGPYELHDFFLYHMLHCGEAPDKILRLAAYAFHGRYDESAIGHWLNIFLKRFFSQQFKRSCMPDGPKISAVSLSPRGDWRMPSDASDAAWCLDTE